MFRRRRGEASRSRSLFKLIQRISCLSAAARLTGWRRSSRIGWDLLRWALGKIRDKADEETSQLLKHVTPHDLVKFGMIPELRAPVITTLKEVDEEALVRILTEPKNAMVKHQTLFNMDGVDLGVYGATHWSRLPEDVGA